MNKKYLGKVKRFSGYLKKSSFKATLKAHEMAHYKRYEVFWRFSFERICIYLRGRWCDGKDVDIISSQGTTE